MLRAITVRHIILFLFFCTIFFIPFNSYDGISLFGEYRREGAIFFVLAGILCICIEIYFKKTVYLPRPTLLLKALYFFLIWIVLASLINLPSIKDQIMKGISGPNRLLRQLISVLLALLVVPYFFSVAINKLSLYEIFKKVRWVFLLSLAFVTIYSLFEIAIVFLGIDALRKLHGFYDYLPFIKVGYSNMRISSITQEPPYFAIYLITIFGWMLSYILTGKKLWKYIPGATVLVLGILSGSRTALVVILMQFITFMILLAITGHKKDLRHILSVFAFSIMVVFLFKGKEVTQLVQDKIESINFKKNLTSSVSNKSRLGIQKASIQVFKDHPLVGVGYGQQSFHNRFYYPPWASTDNYEFRLWYKNPNTPSFPPGYNLYVRLLAELGIIGLIVFLVFLGIAFRIAIRAIGKQQSEFRNLGIIMITSLIGFGINWLQIDSFRLFGFALLIVILHSIERQLDKTELT